MGLALADEPGSALRGWALPAALALVAAGLELAGLTEALRYERVAIAGGELWRLASGHAVHLGWMHLLLNLAGLALVWMLVGPVFTVWQWVLVSALCIAGTDAGFWWLSPELDWYVGLSGILHGLLVAGALASVTARGPRRAESLVLLALVGAKLGWEQWVGPVPGSASVAGGPVVVDAHLYGAVAGAVAGLLVAACARRGPSD